MNVSRHKTGLNALLAVFFAFCLSATIVAAPAVRVTLQLDATNLKVGETTIAHVMAQIVPEQQASAEQIFSWYVDLLNSAPAMMQIEASSVVVPTSDSDPSTSSRGTLTAGNLRTVYDSFLETPGAGRDAPIELFSVRIKAAAVGTARFSVAAGTGAPALDQDFIVSGASGEAIYGGLYDTAFVDVTSFNNVPPTLDPIADATINEGSPVTFTAAGHDADAGQVLRYSFVGTALPGATLDPVTGAFGWTPGENNGPGVFPVRIRVSDNGTPPMSATNQMIVTVNEVNTAPRLQVPATINSAESQPISAQCTATDSDFLQARTPNVNKLTFSLIDPPPGASINSSSGAFTWTPTEAQGPGTYTITVEVGDDGVPPLAETKSFTINISEQNRPPTLTAPAAQTIVEGATMNVAFVASDPDLPANPLTFSLVSGPPGAVLDPGTGVVSWTPTEAQGPNTFTIQVAVNDNGSPPLSETKSVQVTVTEINAAPTLNSNSLPDRSVTELTPLTFTVTATDTDLPAQTLSYALDNPPAGATINPTTGAFSWTPTEAQGPGRYTIVVRVTDNGSPARPDTRSFDVTVNEQNVRPTLTTPAGQADVTRAELTPLSIQFTAADTDLPANLITFSLASAPSGMSINAANGLLTWTASEEQGPGVYNVQVIATDNAALPLATTNIIKVTVTESNVAPRIVPIDDRSIVELQKLTVAVEASDSDLPAQTLTYFLIGPPAGAAISASGVFTWTPSEAQGPGIYNIVVQVRDSAGQNSLEEFKVTVTEENTAPVLTVPQTMTRAEMALIEVQMLAADSDVLNGILPDHNLVTFSLIDAPAGASVNPQTGLFSWTPTEAQGGASYTIRVVARDDGNPALSDTESFTINVTEANRAPVITAPANQTIAELSPLSATFTATDPDLPANTLTFSLLEGPAGVQVSPNGLVTWTPTEGQGPGTYPVKVAATDNGSPAASVNATMSVTVTEVQVTPSLAAITDRTVTELTPLTLTAVGTDADLPAQALTYSLESPPPGATINSTSGAFSWTPTEAQGPGEYTITVRVTDSGTLFDRKSFKVTVNEANVAPSVQVPATQSKPEMALITLNCSATDTDFLNGAAVTANRLTFSLLNPPEGAAIDPTTGVFTWTPTEIQGPASHTIRVVVTDNGSPAMSGQSQFVINVTEVNRGPTIIPPADQVVQESSAMNVAFTATDPDLPANALTFSLLEGPQGVVVNANGTVTWTPTEAQGPGTFAIKVAVTDNGSPAMTANATMNVTVTEQNTAPVLTVPGNQSRPELALITLNCSVTDADILNGRSPAVNLQTFKLLNPPAGASIDATTGVFTWTPTETQGPGNYPIEVQVTDDGSPAASVSKIFTIAVTEANSPPTITAPPAQSVHESSTLNVAFLASDTDVPANTLTFSLLEGPPGVVVNPTTGNVTWTPTEAQGPGAYSIKVAVTDNGSPSMSVNATLNVTVTELNSPPTLAAISDRSVMAGSALTFNVTATDTDLPAQTLLYSIDSGPEGVSINANTGAFTWTPTAAQALRDYIVIVRAAENGAGGLFDTRSFKVTVTQKPAQTEPTVRLVSVLPAGVTLRIEGEANATYTIEFSTDLVNWSTLTTVSLGNQTFATYLDALHGLGQTKGFYRAKVGGITLPAAASVHVNSLTATGYSLRVTGDSGAAYRIEFSGNFMQWTSIGSVTLSAGTSTDYLDTAQSTRGNLGFYRAVTP